MAVDQTDIAPLARSSAPPPLRAPDWLNPARLLNGLWRYTPLLILALAWEAATRLGLVSPMVLPSLDKVMSAWWGLAASGDLSSNAIVSLSRGATGLLAAIVVGITLGVG